jgi:hypothetical protein
MCKILGILITNCPIKMLGSLHASLITSALWSGGGDVDITGPCRAAYSEGPGYTEYLDRKFQRVFLNLYNKS